MGGGGGRGGRIEGERGTLGHWRNVMMGEEEEKQELKVIEVHRR